MGPWVTGSVLTFTHALLLFVDGKTTETRIFRSVVMLDLTPRRYVHDRQPAPQSATHSR
jgi:hypothetical protein